MYAARETVFATDKGTHRIQEVLVARRAYVFVFFTAAQSDASALERRFFDAIVIVDGRGAELRLNRADAAR